MNRIETLHSNVFSQKNVELFEKNIMFLAVGGFIVHLLLIFFENYYGIDIFSSKTNLSSNPIQNPSQILSLSICEHRQPSCLVEKTV